MKCGKCNKEVGDKMILCEITGEKIYIKPTGVYDKNDVLCANCWDKDMEEELNNMDRRRDESEK
ncbi:MAG TPA: hypothetical protein ENI23_02335 [bacterium]|nr:hypothetical protein [bacterium]